MKNLQEGDSATLRFKRSAQIEVVESYDEAADKAETTTETFSPGDEVEVDVLSVIGDGERISIQFPDGSCAYCVNSEVFEVVRVD